MRKSKLLNVLLVFLLITLMLSACGPNWDEISRQRDGLVSQLGTETARMADSKAEVDKHSGDFPAHYTTESKPQLDAAQKALADIGDTQSGWLFELNDAIEKKDRKTATERLDWIKGAMDTIGAYTLRIIGPPEDPNQGLYATLQAKVDLLHTGFVPGDNKDLFGEVQALDAPTLATIQAAKATNPFYLCGSTTQMTYKFASGDYGSGLASYKEAEGYFAQDDLPAASDALVESRNSFNSAVGTVANAVSNHETAYDAIKDAKSSKTIADAAVLMIWADYWSTVSSERSSGIDDLTSAQTMCESEDFASAGTYANSAKGHFDSAIYWSTQEEPEPVVVESDNDEETPTFWPEPSTSDYQEPGDYYDGGSGGSDYPDDNSGGDDYYDGGSGGDYYPDDSSGGGDPYDDGGSQIIPPLQYVFNPTFEIYQTETV